MKLFDVLEIAVLVSLLTGTIDSNLYAQKLSSPPMATDRMAIVEGSKSLLATSPNTNIVTLENGKALGLRSETNIGSVTVSRKAAFDYNEMVPSWNVVCTTGTGMRLWMSKEPSPGEKDWFVAAQWGTPQPPEVAPRKQKIKHGEYVSDTLILNKPSQYLHWRVEFFRESPQLPSPKLYLLAACYSNTLGNARIFEQFGDNRPVKLAPTGKKIELQVPFKAQIVNDQSWVGRICSPTSVATAVGKFGIRCTVNETARLTYDPAEDIFGNWNRSVAAGSQFGARGYITRFRNFAQVHETLKKGNVICASIKFDYGTVKLDEVPVMYAKRGTEGHLVVLTGIDKDGKIITHDNASKKDGPSCRWSQDALITAWFNTKGGVGYVFTGKR